MKFLKFLSHLQKYGLSYEISRISFSSPKNVDYHMRFLEISFYFSKTWTIICNFYNFFLFPKNVDYHMQFMKFFSLLQKCGLSYAISRISSSSPKTWTIVCNF